jgi:hypothetical protein
MGIVQAAVVIDQTPDPGRTLAAASRPPWPTTALVSPGR